MVRPPSTLLRLRLERLYPNERRVGEALRRQLKALLVLVSIGFFPAVMTSVAQAQEVVAASPDVTIALSGGSVTATDGDVAVDNQLGVVSLESLGPIPVNADVVAYALDLSGDRLFALDTTTSLPGPVVAGRGDIIRYDGATYTIEFDASANSVPTSAIVDAFSPSASGLLLSFDTTVSLPGAIVAADEDLVNWSGGTYTLALDGSAAGIDASLDVDAAQDRGAGTYYVSLDTNGSVGGIDFADEDILAYDGTNWTLVLDASTLDSNWAAADLDAVFVPEPRLVMGLVAGLGLIAAARRTRDGIA